MDAENEDVLADDGWHCAICGFEGASEFVVWGHIGAKHQKRRKPVRHGTVAGYRAEKNRGVTTCPACRVAWRRYYRRIRAMRKRTR